LRRALSEDNLSFLNDREGRVKSKMKRLFLSILLVFTVIPGLQAAPVALFYMTNSPDSIRSFLAHSSQIDLIVPTWYQVDENGLVTGAPEPTVLKRAQDEKLPVMPIIALFDKKKFHTLSASAAAQTQMNDAMIRESKLHGFVGFQLDLENIDWTDRDQLTDLVKNSADALHKAGLQLTIATVPNAPGYPGSGGFAKWIYTDWRGAYDIAAIAKYVDILCLMTYDQHTRWTMPGPVAGWDWTVDNLNYALKVVPKEKLSLGIPLYGYHWYAGAPTKENDKDKPNPTAEYIGTPNALLLAEAYNGKIQWDAEDHNAYFFFYRDQMREWIFFTDARTFKDRYDLVQKDGLQGFCSWVLGEEDPGIWKVLPERRR
jgi:spore germination protein YaaH